MSQHSGALVQGSYGSGMRNFELVVPGLNGEGLIHYSRDNDDRPERWGGPTGFGTRHVTGVALIQSDFGRQRRNLEAVACEDDALVHYWRDDPSFIWYRRMTPIATGVRGTPGFIQRPPIVIDAEGAVARGNFEVVAPLANGALGHWWRDNRHKDLLWHGPDIFGNGVFDAVALTQSNFGMGAEPPLAEGEVFTPPGNLEIVARRGAELLHFFRDQETERWFGPVVIPVGAEVTGSPVLIQSTYGWRGHFQLVVPLAEGGLVHLQRDNDSDDLRWEEVHRWEGGEMSIIGLVQSTLGRRGNLELVVRAKDRLEHHWFDTTHTRTGQWVAPEPVAIEHIRTEAEGAYGWTASYLQEGSHIIVRIQLMPEGNVDPVRLEAAKERWRKGILDTWNCGRCCRTARGITRSLTFDVEWVEGDRPPYRPFDRERKVPAHHRVKVWPHQRRATVYAWGLNTSAEVAAHEFGHMLGLPDEYEDPRCPHRRPVRTGTVMDVLGGRVEPRLVEHLCAPMCNQVAA